MEFVYLIIGIVVLLLIIKAYVGSPAKKANSKSDAQKYFYARKDSIMTETEARFFGRLQAVAGDRYFVFPQVHLSSLMINKTKGKYYKLGYQRLLRRSVDYVLCDKTSMRPIYAVELDDTTHDSQKRQARDAMVEQMLSSIGLPLVRFRNVGNMTDDDIARKFEMAANNAPFA